MILGNNTIYTPDGNAKVSALVSVFALCDFHECYQKITSIYHPWIKGKALCVQLACSYSVACTGQLW